MARKATWGSWAPGKAERVTVQRDYATVYLPWGLVSLGWGAFAELEAQRVARGWAQAELFSWWAAYGGAFVTVRRRW